MLIKEPIIIWVALLCAVCFIWFFLLNRRFPKIAILILDSIVIILSIGTILSGMRLRERVLDEGMKEKTEGIKEQQAEVPQEGTDVPEDGDVPEAEENQETGE